MSKHYTGAGQLTSADYRYAKYTGRAKNGDPIAITLPRCINLTNPDWKFAEKDDTTAEIELTGVYDDEKLANGDRTEPWDLELPDGLEPGNGEILLGVGRLEIGTSADDISSIGLTRGGGSFTVEREYRNINADNDPGPVEGRIHLEGGVPKLKLTALQWLTKVSTLYPAVVETTDDRITNAGYETGISKPVTQ